MSSKRQPKTIQELRIAAHHLQYEKEMLEFVGTRLTQSPRPTNLYYAVLMESFLIHVRNLNEFFYGWEMARGHADKLREDDVIVEDFFDYKMPWIKPLDEKLPDDLRQRINKQLAHLTYARKIGHYGDWDYSDLMHRMGSLLEQFFQAVAPEKITDG